MNEPKLKRPVRLGVNVFDIQELSPTIWVPIAKNRIAMDKNLFEIVDKNRTDEIAAVFTCPVLEAALALDSLLSENRAQNQALGESKKLRAYIHRGLNWVKLSPNVVLTLWDEDKDYYVLHPDVFPLVDEPVMPSDIVPLAPSFSLFRRKG